MHQSRQRPCNLKKNTAQKYAFIIFPCRSDWLFCFASVPYMASFVAKKKKKVTLEAKKVKRLGFAEKVKTYR